MRGGYKNCFNCRREPCAFERKSNVHNPSPLGIQWFGGKRRNALDVGMVPSAHEDIEHLPLEPTIVEDRIYVNTLIVDLGLASVYVYIIGSENIPDTEASSPYLSRVRAAQNDNKCGGEGATMNHRVLRDIPVTTD